MTIVIILLRVLIPPGIVSLIFGLSYILSPAISFQLAAVTSLYFLPLAGIFAAPAAGIKAGMNPFFLVGWLVLLEVCCALFVGLNIVYLQKIPVFGVFMKKSEERGRGYLRDNPWARKLSLGGIITLVLLPIQGSGPLAAPVIGRIIGMKVPEIVLGVCIGASLRFIILSLLAMGVL